MNSMIRMALQSEITKISNRLRAASKDQCKYSNLISYLVLRRKMTRSIYKPSAGIVVLRHMDGDWNVLCLKTYDNKYDLTKGIVDEGEDVFSAAIRETREEAGITEVSFPFGKEPCVYDACVMFVGVTSQEPEILPNPYTGIREHSGYTWLPIVDAVNSSKIKKFLQPSVMHAFELVLEHDREQKGIVQ